MRAYVITSGTVFGLVLVAHVARVVDEGLQVASDPLFVVSSMVALGLVLWAWRVVPARS